MCRSVDREILLSICRCGYIFVSIYINIYIEMSMNNVYTYM